MVEQAITEYMSQEEAKMQYMTDLAKITRAYTELEKVNMHLQREINVANRKKRRRTIRQELETNSNGDIVLITWHDDGAVEQKFFIMNARGEMRLYLLSSTDCHLDSQIAVVQIEGGGSCIAVMCFLSRMKRGHYIYQQMQIAGIAFNPEIPSDQIYKILETWFFRARNNAGNITSKVLHGWVFDGKKAKFLDCSPLAGFRDIVDELGIRQACFERVKLTEERREGFISELLQFKEKDTRLVMLLAPFMGLFKKLIESFMGGQTVWINFVATSEIPINMVSAWIQILDRNILSDGSVRRNEKERNRQLEQLSDENLVVDVRRYAGELEYSQKTKRQVLAHYADLVRNHRYVPGTNKHISAALFSVSDCYEDGGALNVILPDHDEIDENRHRMFVERKCLEGVMTAVVDFAESNFTNVAQILRKSRLGEKNENIFTALFEILTAFWEREGIDVMERLDMEAKFDKLFETMDEQDDTLDVFVDVVREQICKYRAVDKYQDYYEEMVIYYDRDYIYFPKDVLAGMYQSAHRGSQWKKALIQLKTDGYLSTSSPDVLIKKLQVGGSRHNFYALERDFFDAEGYVDVLDLAREV